jgi:plastocyanin
MAPLVALFVVAALAADQSVTASGTQFTPDEVTINQGEKVTWTNAQGEHNVRFDDGFVQPATPQPPGMAWPVSRTFNTPGTYSYVCVRHELDGMRGTVTVLAASSRSVAG